MKYSLHIQENCLIGQEAFVPNERQNTSIVFRLDLDPSRVMIKDNVNRKE